MFAAGCGVGQFGSVSDNGVFSVSASSTASTSNGQIQFSAQLPSDDPAPVVWTVSGGDNASSLGQGHINANGTYTPPSALSQDAVHIEVTAHLKDDPAEVATKTITITPGFVQ